jgi:hypothetical protein
LVGKYLTYLGYKQDMIEWAIAAAPNRRRCLNQVATPELAKQFNIDFWYNTEDGQHYTLPGNHGMLVTAPLPPNKTTLSDHASPYERWGGRESGNHTFIPSTSLPNEWPANGAAPFKDFLKGTQR